VWDSLTPPTYNFAIKTKRCAKRMRRPDRQTKLRALKFTILVLVLAMSGAALACPGGYVLRRNQSPLLPRSVGGEKALLKRRRDMNKPHPRNTKGALGAVRSSCPRAIYRTGWQAVSVEAVGGGQPARAHRVATRIPRGDTSVPALRAWHHHHGGGTVQLDVVVASYIMDQDALAAMWHKSPTINRSLVSALNQTFVSSANALAIATFGATGRVEGVDVSQRNINIVTMPYEALIDVLNQYLKGACENVVIGNQGRAPPSASWKRCSKSISSIGRMFRTGLVGSNARPGSPRRAVRSMSTTNPQLMIGKAKTSFRGRG